MEDCIVIGFDSGCSEVRIRRLLNNWILEERSVLPASGWYNEVHKYSDWEQSAPDFASPLEALKWVADNRFDWREDRPAEAKPEAHIRTVAAGPDPDDWDNYRIPF
jgi:hypothetical protein